MASDRAAFVAGIESVDGVIEEAPKGKPGKIESDADDDLDEDSDADADEVADVDPDEDDAEPDDDEDDEDADLDDEKPTKPDPEVAKRLEQVRRTDKRLREQREQQFEARERQIAEREESLKPRLAELDRYEKLQARGPVAIIEANLRDLTEEDAAVLSRRVYALTKDGKADPRAKAAADHFSKERERDNELNSIKKKLEEQEAERVRAAEDAQVRRNIDVYVGKVAKAATDKTPLAKKLIEADPTSAHAEIEVIAAALSNKLGRIPDAKTVMIAYEKEQRRVLRRFGIDPKTLGSSTTAAPAVKTAPKPGAKPVKKSPTDETDADADDKKPWSREDFVRANGKYD